PTRMLWVWLVNIYTITAILFALGAIRSSQGNKKLYISGILLLIYGFTGLIWPFAPMHQREVLAAGGGNFSDTMHLTLAMITLLLMTFAIGFGAAALGIKFRVYSILTLIALLIFGLLTSMDAPNVAANLPTPLAGVWERINIGVFLLWVVVLAVLLLRQESVQVKR
nr:DUF998 domain-containing protein [Bacteroidia bacterium]